ncbi:hypothetical protein QT327_16830 [Olivibacter sp. 47]|jgi:hypothetical protein|uniref:hypothetical protein n=1 Tax=Olivibacter sp. 47 TaxID=3056486 RepID=UPI0025A40E44|nr:hypothetical protein [Olivibacter sp. 47]MDM8175993.1 hypothetical protein [Olivibacter sp. 47]
MLLPRIIIDQALFYIDISGKQLVETDNPHNIIPFAEMERRARHYDLVYDATSKNVGNLSAFPMSDIPPFELIKIPRRLLEKGYKEGSEYADTFNERSYEIDAGVLLVDSYMEKRLSGELPTVSIAAISYEVDVSNGELTGVGHSATISVHHFTEVDDHLLGFFQKGVPVIPNINSMAEIPKDLSIIEIPKMEAMDPIGYADHRFGRWYKSLRKFSGEGASFAGWGFSPDRTILSDIVRGNREKINAVHTGVQISSGNSGPQTEEYPSDQISESLVTLKETGMPRIIIDQAVFGIDAVRQHLIELGDPSNTISFAGLESGNYFAFEYDRKTRNIAQNPSFSDSLHTKLMHICIPVDLLRSGYKEGSAYAYAFNLECKHQGVPVQLVDRTILDRFDGHLPILEIAHKPYFIDIANEKFEACDKTGTLHFGQFEQWDGLLKGFMDIENGTMSDAGKLTEIPRGLRLLEIPHPMNLDPIGYAARRCDCWAYLLNDNNIYEMKHAVEINPKETMLVKTVRKNHFVKKYSDDLKLNPRKQYKRKL